MDDTPWTRYDAFMSRVYNATRDACIAGPVTVATYSEYSSTHRLMRSYVLVTSDDSTHVMVYRRDMTVSKDKL